MQSGTAIWLIGLSASGKTTLANIVVEQLRDKGHTVVLLDGDLLRDLFKNDVGHTIEGRRINAIRLSTLTSFLCSQGVIVVAAVLSIFPEWQKWNRDNIKNYFQVHVQASMETLLRRETKGLYAKALKGELQDVVGVDIEFPEPYLNDLVIDNDSDVDRSQLEAIGELIIQKTTYQFPGSK